MSIFKNMYYFSNFYVTIEYDGINFLHWDWKKNEALSVSRLHKHYDSLMGNYFILGIEKVKLSRF